VLQMEVPRKCGDGCYILNLRFKSVAYRVHQALPRGTRTTAPMSVWQPTTAILVHRIYNRNQHCRGQAAQALGGVEPEQLVLLRDRLIDRNLHGNHSTPNVFAVKTTGAPRPE
jgi:hypothetical protein